MDVPKNLAEKVGGTGCGLLIIGLSIVVIVLLIMHYKMEGFTANTVGISRMGSDQGFGQEGYIAIKGDKERMDAAPADPNAGYYRQAGLSDAPSVGSVTLQGCQVSSALNADPYSWLYQAVAQGTSAQAAANAAAAAPTHPGRPAAPAAGKEGMSDASLGLAMAGGNAKQMRL